MSTIVTGGNGKYLKLAGIAPLSTADSWSFETEYTYKGGGSYPIVFGSSNSSYYYTPFIHVSSNTFRVWLSASASSFLVEGGNSGVIADLNTNYKFKLGYDGTDYYLDTKIFSDGRNPILTANGTIGGDSYGCTASHENLPAWYAFDGDVAIGDRCWWTAHGKASETNPCWITYYSPTAIIPTGMWIMNEVTSPANMKNAYIQGSNDNSTWDTLYTITDRPNTTGLGITYTLNTTTAYKYFRLYVYDGWSTGGIAAQEIRIFGFPTGWPTDYTRSWSYTSSTKVYCNAPFLLLNNQANLSSYYSDGSINLTNTTIKTTTDGVETTFFDGATASGDGYYNEGCTITNGIVTGFSASNYLQTSGINSNINSKNYKIITRVQSTSISNEQAILYNANSYGIRFYSSKLNFYNGTSYTGSTSLSSNIWYWVGYSFDGSKHKVYLAADDGTYTSFAQLPEFSDSFWTMEVNLSNTTNYFYKGLFLGYRVNSTGYYFRGSIDLNNTIIGNNLIHWKVSNAEYITQQGITTISEDTTKNVILEAE